MFTAALLTRAKTWKQPKCLPTEACIKMWYIHTMGYNSAMKKSKIRPFAAPWIEQEIITPSEVSQTKKTKYHMVSFICGI